MMSLTATGNESVRVYVARRLLLLLWGMGLLLFMAAKGHADDSTVPWECSNYSREAQTRCMQAMIELQREKIGRLEGDLEAQRRAAGQLREQLDRQANATTDLQRQLGDRPFPVVPAPIPYLYPYPSSYVAPPTIGFGLYFGRPWIYGPSYHNRPPYWDPRLYRHWRHRW